MVPERVKNASGRDSGVSFLLLCFASLPDRAHSSASSREIPGCLRMSSTEKMEKNSFMRFTRAKPESFTWLNSYAYG